MSYCLLQADSVAPGADQLKRAFKSLKTLTGADAVKLANDACGVLVKNLSHEDAGLLQHALQSEGVPTEIVEAVTFMFKYCFDRPELSLPQKLGLLMQMIASHAPQAVLNRGATALRDGALDNAAYASVAALFDESIWLLWRTAKKSDAPGGL